MVNINNQELKRAFSDSTKTQLSEQPNQVNNNIVSPVVDVTPNNYKKIDLIKTASASASTNATIHTASTVKDTYICAANLSFIKDASATATRIWIQTTIGGLTVYILETVTLTLTADSKAISISFPKPIKIDKGALVRVFADTYVANQRIGATIYGYEDDTL